jgi:hypothetical protein
MSSPDVSRNLFSVDTFSPLKKHRTSTFQSSNPIATVPKAATIDSPVFHSRTPSFTMSANSAAQLSAFPVNFHLQSLNMNSNPHMLAGSNILHSRQSSNHFIIPPSTGIPQRFASFHSYVHDVAAQNASQLHVGQSENIVNDLPHLHGNPLDSFLNAHQSSSLLYRHRKGTLASKYQFSPPTAINSSGIYANQQIYSNPPSLTVCPKSTALASDFLCTTNILPVKLPTRKASSANAKHNAVSGELSFLHSAFSKEKASTKLSTKRARYNSSVSKKTYPNVHIKSIHPQEQILLSHVGPTLYQVCCSWLPVYSSEYADLQHLKNILEPERRSLLDNRDQLCDVESAISNIKYCHANSSSTHDFDTEESYHSFDTSAVRYPLSVTVMLEQPIFEVGICVSTSLPGVTHFIDALVTSNQECL